MESIEVPYQNITPETLNRLIEEFVCREGTDYGHSNYTLGQKVAQVKRQILTKKAKIVFDPSTETCNIISLDS